jgi:exosortase
MKARHGQFLAALCVALLVWWKPLRNLVQLALSQEDYSYTLLVIAVSAALVLIERWPAPESNRSVLAIGIGLCAITAGVWLNWHIDDHGPSARLSLSILCLAAFILAAFFSVYGRSLFVRKRFPLLLLFLAVPLPQGVVNSLVTALQYGSADAAGILFRILHVPVAREGLLFSFSNLDIEVAKECSGIRSSTVLFVTTLVLAQIYLKSPWNRIIAVICSLPIAIAKNGVRIFTLSVLGEYVSTNWLEGSLHRKGGFIFFALGMAMVIAVIWFLRRRELRNGMLSAVAVAPKLESSESCN